MTGKVFLVGAGPVNPDLITVGGLRHLQTADVVIYDKLIAHSLLDEAPEGAELIDASKTRHADTLTQDQINELLVDRAKQGFKVVRLKGGDPYTFGRGSEEALYCLEHNVEVEVIPGVSALAAATAAAGIPLTHRFASAGFMVSLGYVKPEYSYLINRESQAKFNGTMVFFMTQLADLETILREMLELGYDPETAAAVIHKGGTPDQEVLVDKASTLAEKVRERWGDMPIPSIAVLGAALNLRDNLPRIS
ncbi:MAG: uroporphyrinogen-III C-methyltransferase [Chloroflexi bacterium]|nr:uroporphyrinogen-III C-methyltransferase [Chloroflexota bacterium]